VVRPQNVTSTYLEIGSDQRCDLEQGQYSASEYLIWGDTEVFEDCEDCETAV